MSNSAKKRFTSVADKAIVKRMAALGVQPDLIAKRLGITEDQLFDDYSRELRTALPEMKAMVGANLFARARAGNLAAIAFWLKTRAGWSEAVHREIVEAKPPQWIERPFTHIYLPCNQRQGCIKATPEEKFAALLRIRDFIMTEAAARGMHLPAINGA